MPAMNTTPNSSPLTWWSVINVTPWTSSRMRVDVADERDVLEELHESVRWRNVGVLTRKTGELEHVRPSLHALLGAVLEHLAVAGFVEHTLQEHGKREALRIRAETLHERGEAVQRRHGSRPERLLALIESLGGFERGDALLARELLQLRDTTITDLAAWRVHHPCE